jgi:hypothetical protein
MKRNLFGAAVGNDDATWIEKGTRFGGAEEVLQGVLRKKLSGG